MGESHFPRFLEMGESLTLISDAMLKLGEVSCECPMRIRGAKEQRPRWNEEMREGVGPTGWDGVWTSFFELHGESAVQSKYGWFYDM